MFLGSSCCNIAENSTFARPLDFACRLNPSFHAFAEACATETLGAYGYSTLSRAEKCTPAVSEAGPGIFCAVPGSQGVGASIFTGRASRLLCLEYRRGAQKIPERCPVKHRQQSGRTAQPGDCDHPKELSFCRK